MAVRAYALLGFLRSKLSQETLNAAIASILKGSQEKKRKFVETIELQISGEITPSYMLHARSTCFS